MQIPSRRPLRSYSLLRSSLRVAPIVLRANPHRPRFNVLPAQETVLPHKYNTKVFARPSSSLKDFPPQVEKEVSEKAEVYHP